MTRASQDARAGGERGRRPGASAPWATPLERIAAALAYRETGDPFAGTMAAAPGEAITNTPRAGPRAPAGVTPSHGANQEKP